MNESVEKTGTNYKCLKCNHTWDYQDDACPECGGKFEDTNQSMTEKAKAKELQDQSQGQLSNLLGFDDSFLI